MSNPYKIIVTLPESDGRNTKDDEHLATLALNAVRIALRSRTLPGYSAELIKDEESK